MTIDFSTPEWLIDYYHVIGTISLILNATTIYLVIFQSSKIDNFRYFILGFQVICTITDFHLTFLMQPLPLFPIIAGFSISFAAINLDIWMHYLMAFLIASMVAQMEALALCFLRKHQTIAKIIKKRVISTVVFNSIAFSLATLPFVFFWIYDRAGIQRDKQMDFVREKYPQLVDGFSSLRNFCIYELNSWFWFLAVAAFAGGTFCAFLCSFSTIDMFRMLKGAQRKVSAVSYKRHQSAVKSLFAQFTASSVCSIPPLIFVVVVMSEFEHAQKAVQLILVFFALHSSVNAIVLIASTPPYRSFVLRKTIRKPAPSVKVSPSHISLQ